MTDASTTLSSEWSSRHPRIAATGAVGRADGAVGHLYEVGSYVVEVWLPRDAGCEVTVVHRHRAANRSDPRHALPNLYVSPEGELSFPIEDLVPIILDRLSPADLAEALWIDAKVRAAFIDRAIERYSDHFFDAERRRLLTGLGGAIHSIALDVVAGRLAAMEHHAAHRFQFYMMASRFRDLLSSQGLLDDEGRLPTADGRALELPSISEPEELRISLGSGTWSEARDHWREEARAMLPPPSAREAELADLVHRMTGLLGRAAPMVADDLRSEIAAVVAAASPPTDEIPY